MTISGSSERVKPTKPYPGYPLTPHASGKWTKRINGKSRYYGTWEDPDAALREYLDETEDKNDTQSITISEGINLFLTAQRSRADRNEISHRSLAEYVSTGRHVVRHFGRDFMVESLTPARFEEYRNARSAKRNLISLGNEVQRVRTMFGWMTKMGHTGKVEFGPDFKKPSNLQRRRHKRERGSKVFERQDLLWIIEEASVQLRAMILLGINCGYYPAECAKLTVDDIDFDNEWISVPRWKTEEDRDAWLWPETIDAINTWLESPVRQSDNPLLFHRRDGSTWDTTSHPISVQFRQIAARAKVKSGTFEWLRHTCETVGGGCRDQVAVNRVMGHVDRSLAGTYRHGIDRERTINCCNHIREWLYA